MQVQCSKGHSSAITDPGDEGWEYESTERFEPTTVTLPDGSQTQIQHRVPVPVRRRMVWKCTHPTPTDDNPAALCGEVETIVEDVEQPVEEPLTGGDQ